jgi:hypothetical protein
VSDLTSSLAALAKSLDQPAGVPAAVTDRVSATAVIDVNESLAMPLDEYARAGAPLEVRVPWHGETLWLVPDERHAEILAREGVSRGRIWAAGELMDLMALPERTPETVRTIALAKVAIDGEIVEVRRR